MPDASRETLLAAELVALGEAFVLAWSAMPPDLPERISASQLRALVAVRRAGELSVTELARTLDALPSSATRLCDRLVAAGLIERIPAVTNRRFHAISLTAAGQRLLQALDQHRERVLEGVLAGMPPRTRRQLLEGLAAFSAEVGRGEAVNVADRGRYSARIRHADGRADGRVDGGTAVTG